MKTIILICGLPGAGKTTLAQALIKRLPGTVEWLNADQIRGRFNDWDFSKQGRERQGLRMTYLAAQAQTDYVVCDFVAPYPDIRANIQPNILIWMDTIEKSKYVDTNREFMPPTDYSFRITEKDADKWARIICDSIFDPTI
jgi:adenylylsulfate kinase-like enzyme